MDDSRKSLCSGDEVLLENGHSFTAQLNPGRSYSSIATWRLVVLSNRIFLLTPRRPLNMPNAVVTIITGIFFYLCASFVSSASQIIVYFVAVASLICLWGIQYYFYLRENRYGNWLEIDCSSRTVSLPRFNAIFDLDKLRILVISRLPARRTIGDAEPVSTEKFDIDAVLDNGDGTFMRFSLVGELGNHATRNFCNILKKAGGIPILSRTIRDVS